jgi:hypothetical protein
MPDWSAISENLRQRGMAGRGSLPSYMNAQSNLDEDRRQAMLKDILSVGFHLDSNNPGAAEKLLQDRLGYITQLGGDPSQSQGLLRMLQEGRTDEVKAGINDIKQLAIVRGDLKAPGDSLKGYQFENPKLVKRGDSYSWEGVKHNPNDGTSGPYSVPLGSAAGMEIVQSSTGQTPSERVPQIGSESVAREQGKAGVQLTMAPKIARRVTTAKAEVADMFKVAAGNRDMAKNHQVYQAAMGRMTDAFGIAYTGPGMDWMPAITANRQKVLATVNIMRPVIKKAIRGPGEGTFTDADQKVLDSIMPTLGDHDSVVNFKIGLIDEFMAGTNAPQEAITAGGGQAVPTQEDISFTAKKHGITEDEVRKRLGL